MAGPYTPNTGNAATFNPLYDSAKVSYNRTDPAAPAGATTQTSNRIDTFCSSCHGDFHGGATDANIGGNVAGVGAQDFIRHPTSKQVIGLAANGGQSSLTRYVANTNKVKVYSSVAGFTDATPGCVSCHKAHGNQNPFGLVFLSRTGAGSTGYDASMPEEGFYNTASAGYQQGYRNLCGQCHSQGN